MNRHDLVVIGAGMTGLAAGLASGAPVFEASTEPGGICSSYYVRPGEEAPLSHAPADGEAYRFEIGGGHWIFGGDPAVIQLAQSLVPILSHPRRSSVYFRSNDLYVPYPLQNHLRHLGREISFKALQEIAMSGRDGGRTMKEWLEQSFGSTLTDLFFGPFHERYTAGLWKEIAPQDGFKSPSAFSHALKGALLEAPPVGYNVNFVYPPDGLDVLSARMAKSCTVYYGKRAVGIDVRERIVHFADGSPVQYGKIISTVPLNLALALAGVSVDAPPDPYTSVLVLNIGGARGPECPDDHWIYAHENTSGFHRVGFYSNVDASFLPVSSRRSRSRVSIYVERSFRGGDKPTDEQIQSYVNRAIAELIDWGFLERAEVAHPTWIDVAYTWAWPGSSWRSQAMEALASHGIFQVGRYGRWIFQGIADSIRDGLMVGAALRGR